MQLTAVTYQHNLATEKETRRHNLATEQNEANKLAETVRNNKRQLQLEYDKLSATEQRNLNDYTTALLKIANDLDHNRATEQQARDELTALNKRFEEEQFVKLTDTLIQQGKLSISGPFNLGFTINPSASGLTAANYKQLIAALMNGDASTPTVGEQQLQQNLQDTWKYATANDDSKQAVEPVVSRGNAYLTKLQNQRSRIEAKLKTATKDSDVRYFESQLNHLDAQIDKATANEVADVSKEEAYENAKRETSKSKVSSNDSGSQSRQLSNGSSSSKEKSGPGIGINNSSKNSSSGKSPIIYSGGRSETIGPGVS